MHFGGFCDAKIEVFYHLQYTEDARAGGPAVCFFPSAFPGSIKSACFCFKKMPLTRERRAASPGRLEGKTVIDSLFYGPRPARRLAAGRASASANPKGVWHFWHLAGVPMVPKVSMALLALLALALIMRVSICPSPGLFALNLPVCS